MSKILCMSSLVFLKFVINLGMGLGFSGKGLLGIWKLTNGCDW